MSHLFVRDEKKDGSTRDTDLLVPLWWIAERQAKQGGKVQTSVPECGIDGYADVVKLGPCPSISDPEGRVIAAVYRHHSAQGIDRSVACLDGPIGTTICYSFFSVDRSFFVRADTLQTGELFRRIDGSTVP